jgi:LysM repeat protein
VQTDQAKGRNWNGYVCPGCRNVFRVAADFAGDEVMCPSCQETLRLPKKPEDVPPHSFPVQLTPPAPAATADENQTHGDADEPLWRTLLASPGGRRKLALALGAPLLLVAVVLMFLPANQPPAARKPPTPPPALQTEAPAAPLPETDAPPIADLSPEVLENETPPPAVPGVADPALLAEVPDAPKPTVPVDPLPGPVNPEHGLVEAIPATPPVAQPPAMPEKPAEPAVTIHTVVKGDTLTRISNSYRVSVSEIQQANQLKNDTVEVGQQLRIPGAAPQLPAPAPAVEKPVPAATRHHAVVRGDTLTRIGRKYGVEPKAIMRANGMKNDIVRLGAKLVIPPADR